MLGRLALIALGVTAAVFVVYEADRSGLLGYARHVKAQRFRRRGREVEAKRDCDTGRFLKTTRKPNDCIVPRPTPWYEDPRPVEEQAVCYPTRSQALRAFVDANQDVIDRAGGMMQVATDGSWDAVNERYGLRGRRKVKNVRGALEAVMPHGKPFCLDQLDIETLNETRPAQEAGGFRLPDVVEEEKLLLKQGDRAAEAAAEAAGFDYGPEDYGADDAF